MKYSNKIVSTKAMPCKFISITDYFIYFREAHIKNMFILKLKLFFILFNISYMYIAENFLSVQSARAVGYADCISAEE